MSNTSLTHLDGEEFVESTRLIRRWLNYETVPADAVAAELRKWADHCAPAPTDSFGEYDGRIYFVPSLVDALESLLDSFGSRVSYNPEPSRSATVSTRRLGEIAAALVGERAAASGETT